MKLVYDNLENNLSNWLVQIGANIDKDIPDAMIPTIAPDGSLKLDNVSSKKPGGGLITNKIKFDPYMLNLPYVGVDLEYFVGNDQNPGRLEFDLKLSYGNGLISDFSSQLNGSKATTQGWMFQIDDKTPTWVDTGIYVPVYRDQWQSYSARMVSKYGTSFSFLSINRNQIPTLLQNVQPLKDNWGVVAALQLQTKASAAGVLTARYRKVTVTFSDSPF